MGRLLTILSVAFCALSVFAETIYVGQSSSGSDTGSDAANRHSISWLNTAGNWGTDVGDVSPGDTVRLVGTITTAFVPPASGTAGNPVDVVFESGAKFSSTAWSSSGVIQFNGVSWINIDGGVNGMIENTANGPGLTYTNNSRGIGGNMSGVGQINNTIIKNLTVTNIFKKTAGMNDWTRYGYPIDLSGSSITVSNCVLSDGDGVLGYSAVATASSNVFFLNNTILDWNHGIVIGVGNSDCYVTNIVISGNTLDYGITWDTTGDSPSASGWNNYSQQYNERNVNHRRDEDLS
jgi:hypothetical protein